MWILWRLSSSYCKLPRTGVQLARIGLMNIQTFKEAPADAAVGAGQPDLVGQTLEARQGLHVLRTTTEKL